MKGRTQLSSRFPRSPRPLPRRKPNSASPTSADIRRREKPRTRVHAAPSRAASFPPSKLATDARNLRKCVATDIPHELRDEFPQEISLIERMIRTNYEFRRLAERYDEVNRNIYRIESGEEPTTDEVLARLKSFPIFGPSNKPDSLQLISPRSSLTLINFAQESF